MGDVMRSRQVAEAAMAVAIGVAMAVNGAARAGQDVRTRSSLADLEP
jgi:hypothetical protein